MQLLFWKDDGTLLRKILFEEAQDLQRKATFWWELFDVIAVLTIAASICCIVGAPVPEAVIFDLAFFVEEMVCFALFLHYNRQERRVLQALDGVIPGAVTIEIGIDKLVQDDGTGRTIDGRIWHNEQNNNGRETVER